MPKYKLNQVNVSVHTTMASKALKEELKKLGCTHVGTYNSDGEREFIKAIIPDGIMLPASIKVTLEFPVHAEENNES